MRRRSLLALVGGSLAAAAAPTAAAAAAVEVPQAKLIEHDCDPWTAGDDPELEADLERIRQSPWYQSMVIHHGPLAAQHGYLPVTIRGERHLVPIY